MNMEASGTDSPPSRELRTAEIIRSAVLTAAAVAAVLAICWLLYRREAGEIADRQTEREAVRVSLLAQLLQSELRPVADDLRLLADGDGFRAYLQTGEPAALQAAIRRAAFFSVQKPAYDQVRYLDQSGREILRVDRGGRVVAAPQLQDKSDRRYFQQASLLPAGSLFISAFDLNVEGGRVEMPPKPMLRFAVPVFDASAHRRGVYVINYLGAGLIDRLQQAAAIYGKRLRLLNAGGYWLKAESPEQEWGFMIPTRGGLTLARSEPELWTRVKSESLGQARGAYGLFTWEQILPAGFAGVVPGALHSDDAFLIMGSAITAPDWDALFSGLRQVALIAAAALVLLVLSSAWLFRGRLLALRRLREANEQLERRVRERTAALVQSNDLLRNREQLLEETGRLAKVGGWEFDPVSGKGRWTAEIARIHDLEVSIEPSKDLGLQFYPGESRVRLEAALQRATAHGIPYDLELEFVTARGERKWVRTISRPEMQDGRVVLMRGALQDVTQRKLAEMELNAQLQRLRLLEQTTRAIGERQDLPSILQVVIRTVEDELPLDFGCICTYDPADRVLTVAAIGLASAGLARELAMDEQASIAIDANGLARCLSGQLVHEPDIAEASLPFPRRLAAGGLRALVAAPLQIESQVFGVLLAARREPNSFSSGECEFLRQLSEHTALAVHQAQLHAALQTAYEDLRNSQQAVMQQERLRVLGQMASGIAHDINNAISPITLYTDSLLDKDAGLSEQTRGYLRTIQQAASDVGATVARMREFYRQRDAQSELLPMDMNALVPQVLELTRARWQAMPQQRGIVIESRVELAPGLALTMGVESEVREALTNLVFNAVDAMPAGGILTLRTRLESAKTAAVEVIDTGSGMDEETRRRCLEPFFTTKGERGTGLGLAMVYGVMQRAGGEIEIDSTPGAGTTVRLSFSLTDAAAAVPEATPTPMPGELTILLIDDDPILLHSLRETLGLDGHTILAADGGQQGIDLFLGAVRQGGGASVSVVITDLGMPHVDGRSVASAVKQASPSTPVILLTGWGERLLAEGDSPANVDRVLSKPPRLRDLRRTLAELTGSRR